jgi:hypothetical protein
MTPWGGGVFCQRRGRRSDGSRLGGLGCQGPVPHQAHDQECLLASSHLCPPDEEGLSLAVATAECFRLLQPVSQLLRRLLAHHGWHRNLNLLLPCTHPPLGPRHDHPYIPRMPIRLTSIGGILQHMLEKRRAPDAISEALWIVTPKMGNNLVLQLAFLVLHCRSKKRDG